MAPDWYRREAWSPEDARDFDARLRRSRAPGRAQYLRIQAGCLMAAPQVWAGPALMLLDRLVEEYPDERQLAPAHQQRGECLLALGRPDEALAAFRAAMGAERAFPQVRTDAYAAFAYAVAAMRRTDLFDEALSTLEEFGGQGVFPVQQYAAAATRALIAAERGDREVERRAADAAVCAASPPANLTLQLIKRPYRRTLVRVPPELPCT